MLTIPSVTFRTLLPLFCFMNTDSCSERCPSHISTIIALLFQHVTRINRGRPLDSSAWNVSTIIISTADIHPTIPSNSTYSLKWEPLKWNWTEEFSSRPSPRCPGTMLIRECWTNTVGESEYLHFAFHLPFFNCLDTFPNCGHLGTFLLKITWVNDDCFLLWWF